MVDTPPLTGKSSIFTPLNSDPSEYLTGVYSRSSFEETKSWLRKLIRRKVLTESSATEYKAIVAPQVTTVRRLVETPLESPLGKKLGPKLNAFINSTKA